MTKAHLRTISTHQIVSEETGVLVHERKNKYLAGDKEEFMFVYVSLLKIIEEDLTLPEVKVYAYLLARYTTGTEIAINKGLKNIMAERMKLNTRTIENALSKLVAKSLLYRLKESMAVYKLNPRYAFNGKGGTVGRKQLLKYVLEVECENC